MVDALEAAKKSRDHWLAPQAVERLNELFGRQDDHRFNGGTALHETSVAEGEVEFEVENEVHHPSTVMRGGV